MKVLILNRFGLSAMDYPAWLGDDVQAYMITSAQAVGGLEPQGYHGVEVVEDYADNPLVEHLCVKWHEEHAFDALIAMSEFDLLRAARIRDLLGIKGQDEPSALAFRDKVRMKEVLARGGVPVARFRPVDSATDLIGFATEVGWPVVVKPRRGASSVGVEVLRGEKDLEHYLAREPRLRGDDPATLIAEEYVPHELIHVDGVYFRGAVPLCWPAEMTSTLGYLDNEVLTSVMLEPGDSRITGFQELVGDALAALPTPEVTIFHAELFASPAHGLLLNEIACRMGGGRIKTAIEVAFGTNLEEWYVRNVLADECHALARTTPEPLAGFALFPPPHAGVFRSAPAECDLPGIRRFKIETALGSTLSTAGSSVDAIATATVEGATAPEVRQRLADIKKWFTSQVEVTTDHDDH